MISSRVTSEADRLFSAGSRVLLADRESAVREAAGELAASGVLHSGIRIRRFTEIAEGFIDDVALLAWRSLRAAHQSFQLSYSASLRADLLRYIEGKLKADIGHRFLKDLTADMKGANLESSIERLRVRRDAALADTEARVADYCTELKRSRLTNRLSYAGWASVVVVLILWAASTFGWFSTADDPRTNTNEAGASAVEVVPPTLVVARPEGFSPATMRDVLGYRSDSGMTALQRSHFEETNEGALVQLVGIMMRVARAHDGGVVLTARARDTDAGHLGDIIVAEFGDAHTEELLELTPGSWILLRGRLAFNRDETHAIFRMMPILREAQLVAHEPGPN